MTTPKCIRPWTSLFNKQTSKVCCHQLSHIGTIDNDSTLDALWNSEKAQELRYDMIISSKRGELPNNHCPLNCSYASSIDWISNNHKFKDIYDEIINEKLILTQPPINLEVVIDHICNLKCKMCWIFDISEKDYKVNEKGFERIIIDIKIKNATYKTNFTAIGGETLYSKYSRYIIAFCIENDMEISFISNMTIYDEKLLNTIPIGNMQPIVISCDAGTHETYSKIRRGNWDILQQNIIKMCNWRNNRINMGENIWEIQISYTIMRSNYNELLLTIDHYLKLPVRLAFSPINNEYRSTSYEQVFNTIPLQQHLLFRLNEAIEYTQNIINDNTYPDFISPLYDTNINEYKIMQCYNIISTLEISKRYLENIMNNEQHKCFNKPMFDYNIDDNKNVIITKL